MLPSKVKWIDATTGEEIKAPYKEPTLKKEMQALQYANTINDLLPQYIRKDKWEMQDGKIYDMIVIERLYILPIHHFDLEIRKTMMPIFEEKMKELHDNDFVHGDFCRPTNFYTRNNLEWVYKNIVQTEQGLRLIDTGFSKYSPKEKAIKDFLMYRYDERQEIPYFKKYYLEEK